MNALRGRAGVIVAALVMLVLAGQLTSILVPGTRSVVLLFSLVGLDVLGLVYSRRAARTSTRATGWRLIAVGRGLSATSTLGFALNVIIGSAVWWWSAVAAGLAMFLCLSVALLLVPLRRLRGRDGWAALAELMTVLVAGFMVIWYLVLEPLRAGPVSGLWVFAVGFPIGNLLLLAAVSATVLRGELIRTSIPARILCAGMLLYVVGDTAFSSMRVHGGQPSHSVLAGGCLVLASLLMTVAAIQQSGSRPGPAITAGGPFGGAAGPTALPYLAVTVGNTLMLVVTIRQGEVFLWGGLVIGQIVMTAFLSMRQMISLRESRQMSITDPLTGLANRAGLDRALDRDEPYGILLIDLDDFKLINDAYGHAAGDAVLAQVAGLIRGTIRWADTPARIGGDEFAVVLADITSDDQAVAAAQRILAAAAANPVRLGEDTVEIRASIGVSLGSPADGAKELLRHADVAMYASKRAGTHSWQLYDPSMVDRRARDAALSDDLAQALTGGQLHVLYQPLVALSDTRPAGVEALLRWQHPVHGIISPLEFIPIAERTGQINQIGLWVLEQACRQVRHWQRHHPAAHALYASVNVSPRQLQEPTLVADVLDVLRRTGLAAEHLVVEVTESATVDEKVAIPVLRELRRHGIRVAIDDFGTGYSSLHYLTRLPVDILKIDRSFVAELDGTAEGSAVTEAVIRLSQVLHLTTVAEGIETEAHAAELQRLGCTIGQGYLYAKPLPAEELAVLLTPGVVSAATE